MSQTNTGLYVKYPSYSRQILTKCVDYSAEIPTRCSFVIEFIIAKFFEGSTCFERHTAIIRSSKLYLQPLVYMPMW